MGYFEIISRGFKVANRNLAVLLTQCLAGIAMLLVFLVFVTGFFFMALGAIPRLNLENLSPENIPGLLQASLWLITIAVFLGFVFVIISALITSYVHAGNLGCVIETARGEAGGFRPATFFSVGRRSMVSMLGLYIIFGLISAGAFMVLIAVGVIGFEAVLIPLKEAGKALTAFGLGVPFLIVLITAALLVLFFLYGGWAFSGIILVGENKGALSSLSGAYNLIRTHFWDSLLFTLLMFVLVFAANIALNILMVPFNITPETRPSAALAVLPVLLISVLLQMYVGLIARSCFAEYYVLRIRAVSGTAMPEPQVPEAPEPPA